LVADRVRVDAIQSGSASLARFAFQACSLKPLGHLSVSFESAVYRL